MVRFEVLIGHNNIRYFSYGRYALAEGLRIAGIKSGSRVLFPEYICRDLLSSVNSLGAVPVFYPVDKSLRPSVSPDDLICADAIIAVNYFGLPQDLTPFRDYCKRTGALLIEDNAHGLLSRDEDGHLLGTRGDIGIFSLRKTIFMPDGAALVLNNPKRGLKLFPQLECSSKTAHLSFRIKKLLRDIVPLVGTLPLNILTTLIRCARKVRYGEDILSSLPDAEHILPGVPNPCKDLFSYLSEVDTEKEVRRRRELYIKMEGFLKDLKLQPVFDSLRRNAVPYGCPFYGAEPMIGKVRALLRQYGLECFRWPELPDAIKPCAPEHYTKVWFVNFL